MTKPTTCGASTPPPSRIKFPMCGIKAVSHDARMKEFKDQGGGPGKSTVAKPLLVPAKLPATLSFPKRA